MMTDKLYLSLKRFYSEIRKHVADRDYRALNLSVVLCFCLGFLAPWWATWCASFIAGLGLAKNNRTATIWQHFFAGFLLLSVLQIVALDIPNGMRISLRLGPVFHLPWGLLILAAPLPFACGAASLATMAAMFKVISRSFQSSQAK